MGLPQRGEEKGKITLLSWEKLRGEKKNFTNMLVVDDNQLRL